MARLHLFEFEDLKHCPNFIRDATTSFLKVLITVLHIYQPAFSKINAIINKTQATQIIDLCSGGGGPIHLLDAYLTKHNNAIPIVLTDKYPNVTAMQLMQAQSKTNIRIATEPVDATNVPKNLKGMRTLFTSFHHFRQPDAVKILQNAVDSHAPIAIFEFTERSIISFIKMIFLSPLSTLALTPKTAGFSWKKIIFTYIFPILLITNLWDGLVSNLRTYSPAELTKLIAQVSNAEHYHWDVGQTWSKQARCNITYLIGYEKCK